MLRFEHLPRRRLELDLLPIQISIPQNFESHSIQPLEPLGKRTNMLLHDHDGFPGAEFGVFANGPGVEKAACVGLIIRHSCVVVCERLVYRGSAIGGIGDPPAPDLDAVIWWKRWRQAVFLELLHGIFEDVVRKLLALGVILFEEGLFAADSCRNFLQQRETMWHALEKCNASVDLHHPEIGLFWVGPPSAVEHTTAKAMPDGHGMAGGAKDVGGGNEVLKDWVESVDFASNIIVLIDGFHRAPDSFVCLRKSVDIDHVE